MDERLTILKEVLIVMIDLINRNDFDGFEQALNRLNKDNVGDVCWDGLVGKIDKLKGKLEDYKNLGTV